MWAERGRLLRPSTVRLLREAARNDTRLHTYLYARLPREYIGMALKFTRTGSAVPRFSPRSRQNAADHYHGKVLPTKLAKALISVNQPIHVPDLEQMIPYPMAREIGGHSEAVSDKPRRNTLCNFRRSLGSASLFQPAPGCSQYRSSAPAVAGQKPPAGDGHRR